jgi:hypothetical protein
MAVKPKNVQTSMTYNRFLYAVLEEEAEKLGVKISHLVNQELSKAYLDKIQFLKEKEKNNYNS